MWRPQILQIDMFSLIPAPYQLLAKGIAVAAIIAGMLWYRHSLIAEGEQHIKDADAKAVAAQIIHNTEIETRAKTLAEQAGHAHDQELTDLRAYRDSHPLGPMFVSNGASHRCPVPAATTAHPRDVETITSAQSVLSVSAGNTESSAIDISGMLEALAGRADQLSAQLREWQGR